MPSPFPGMDPYLEHPAVFPDLQFTIAATLSAAINEVLPERYYAGLASRTWVDRPERLIPDDEFREPMVEIYAEPGGERLVTHIEILSLSNKRLGSPGRELYLRKQREIIDAQVHLIEIDLLRGGEHTIAVPPGKLQRKTPRHDYRVCLHRFDQWVDYVVYPIPLAARLPTIPIPLLPGDPDVMIDLQAVLANCYETGRYERRVRYDRSRLEPPLVDAQQAWADAILANAGQPKLA